MIKGLIRGLLALELKESEQFWQPDRKSNTTLQVNSKMILCTIYIYSNEMFQSHLMFKLHILAGLVRVFYHGIEMVRTPDGRNKGSKNETNSAL